MIGFELLKHHRSFEPDADATKRVITKALDLGLGLVLLSCGVYNNTIRVLVPLTAEDKIVDEGMDLLEMALSIAA